MDSKLKELTETIAKAIYSEDCNAEEHEAMFGKPKRLWETDAPWDSQSDIELCEWERDDYRAQAKAVIKVLRERGISV